MKLLRLNRLHWWKSHRPPKKLRGRWKLLQLPNLRRLQPLRRHPNQHRPHARADSRAYGSPHRRTHASPGGGNRSRHSGTG